MGRLCGLSVARRIAERSRVVQLRSRRHKTRPHGKGLSPRAGTVTYELLSPAPGLGLSLLPEPSPGDLFFDMEGDPFVQDGGLEYFFGVVESKPMAVPSTTRFCAHNRTEERLAFEAFIDFIMARLEKHPDLHIYRWVWGKDAF